MEEACKTVTKLEPNYNPDVIALHVLSNNLKNTHQMTVY